MEENLYNIDIEYDDELTNEEEQNKIDELLMEKKIIENKNKELYEIKISQIEQNNNLNQTLVSAAQENFFNIYGYFFGKNPQPVQKQQAINRVINQTAGKTDDKSLLKQFGLKKNVIVNNISGKKAWIILSPVPVKSISSVGIEKIGNISFSTEGNYKCQESVISDHSSRDFELDNSQIYYTVFFDCDGKWKTPYKNRKINTKKYNINLLERHVNDAIDYDFMPIN